MVGCQVRVVVQVFKDDKLAAAEAIYLEIVEVMENGNLAGTVEPTYRLADVDPGNDVKTGDRVVFNRDQINEIPLAGWQPDEYLEAVKHLQPGQTGYVMTGIRSQ